jgi:hypothetical protein
MAKQIDKKVKEELKNHLKELKINNGKWEAPDGDIYYVCHQGKFYVHTIQITRVPDVYDAEVPWDYRGNTWEWMKKEGLDIRGSQREVCYDRIKDDEGRNLYGIEYSTIEEFDILFDQFLLGYKEYRVLVEHEAINKDFD